MFFLNTFIFISELLSEMETVFASSVVGTAFLDVLMPHSRDFVMCLGFRLSGFCERHIKYIKQNQSVRTSKKILPDALINVRV